MLTIITISSSKANIAWKKVKSKQLRSFSFKLGLIYRNARSHREDFTDLNIRNYDYGLTATFQLPWRLQLSTDLIMFSRRGYNDTSLNTDDLVWNVRLPYTAMKGKLVFMPDGFDILSQLSNVTYELNGQGRVETRRNVLPQYALFHVQYKLNKNPKKK